MTIVVAETGEVLGRTLEECESVIAAGLASFIEVGNALAEVCEARLYRATHETFESYCAERWNLSRSRSYELMEAAAVAGVLSGIPDTPAPANASQANALSGLKDDPPAAAQAMRDAHAKTGGKPTADAIAKAAAEMAAKKQAENQQKQKDRVELDELKQKHQPDDFDEAAESARMKALGKFSRLCKDLADGVSVEEFMGQQREHLKPRHINAAERAYAWLDTFLLEVREETP